MKSIIVKCVICSEDINKKEGHYKFAINKNPNHKFYCNHKCQSKRKRTGKNLKCFTCNTKIYVTKSRLKRSKTNRVYCNRSCATIQNNKDKRPAYSDGRSLYREIAFLNYKHECSVCGYNIKEVLQVHHIDEDRTNNNLTNLVILCPTHHKEAHINNKGPKL